MLPAQLADAFGEALQPGSARFTDLFALFLDYEICKKTEPSSHDWRCCVVLANFVQKNRLKIHSLPNLAFHLNSRLLQSTVQMIAVKCGSHLNNGIPKRKRETLIFMGYTCWMVLDNTTHAHHSFILIGKHRKTNKFKKNGIDLSVENWAGIQTGENDLAMKPFIDYSEL